MREVELIAGDTFEHGLGLQPRRLLREICIRLPQRVDVVLRARNLPPLCKVRTSREHKQEQDRNEGKDAESNAGATRSGHFSRSWR